MELVLSIFGTDITFKPTLRVYTSCYFSRNIERYSDKTIQEDIELINNADEVHYRSDNGEVTIFNKVYDLTLTVKNDPWNKGRLKVEFGRAQYNAYLSDAAEKKIKTLGLEKQILAHYNKHIKALRKTKAKDYKNTRIEELEEKKKLISQFEGILKSA